MVAGVSSELDFFRQVLELRGYRQQILTADIANASTPNFKGVDLDFKQALAAATDNGSAGPDAAPGPRGPILLADDERDLSQPGAAAPALAEAVKYQAGGTVTLDGNSVDLDGAKTEAAENAVQYEAAATFTSQILKMLATAISGAAPSASSGS